MDPSFTGFGPPNVIVEECMADGVGACLISLTAFGVVWPNLITAQIPGCMADGVDMNPGRTAGRVGLWSVNHQHHLGNLANPLADGNGNR
jgi:hypothetical protein